MFEIIYIREKYIIFKHRFSFVVFLNALYIVQKIFLTEYYTYIQQGYI